MKKRISEKTRFEKICEAGLTALAVLTGVYHLAVMLCAYVFDSTKSASPWLAADRYTVLVFFVLALLYIPVKAFAFPERRKELSRFFKNAFGGDRLWPVLLLLWAVIGCIAMKGRTDDFFTFMRDGQARRYLTENAFPINDKFLMDLAVCALILFPLPALLGKYRRAVCEGILHLFTAGCALFMITVLIPYFGGRVVNAPGGQIGVNTKGNMVIACNSNTTGAFSALFLILSLYFVTSPRALPVRVLYAVSAVIQLAALGLSGSRASLLASACAAGVIAFRAVYGLKKLQDKTLSRRLLISVPAGLLAAGLVLLSRDLIRDLYVAVTGFSFVSDKAAGLSGRLRLWGNCLQATFANASNAVFGVTPGFVEHAIGIVRNNPDNVLYAHNQFLQVLLAFGLPGLAIFCVWLYKTAVRCVRVGLKKACYALPAAVLLLVVSNLAESYLTAYFYFCGGMFFLIAGCVAAEDEELPVKKKASPARKR